MTKLDGRLSPFALCHNLPAFIGCQIRVLLLLAHAPSKADFHWMYIFLEPNLPLLCRLETRALNCSCILV